MKFNRYRIAGKGSSLSTYEYFIGDFGNDVDEAKEYILDTYETWARWAEYYKIEVELDVEPTKEFVEKTLEDYKDSLNYYKNSVDELSSLLSKMS